MQLGLLRERLRLPAAFLVALLQRTPVLRVAAGAAGAVLESPVCSMVRAAASSLAALGAVDSVAGATSYSLSTGAQGGHPSPYSVAAGSQIEAVAFQLVANPPTAAPPESWTLTGSVPPGLEFGVSGDFITSPGTVNTANPILEGTPTTPGTYTMTLQAWEFTGGSGISSSVFTYEVIVNGAMPPAGSPVFTTQPISVTEASGTVALDAVASNSPTYQWFLNGSTPLAGATGPILVLGNATASAGTYTCVATNAVGSAASDPATITVISTTDLGRLVSLSARAAVGASPNLLFAGFASGPAGQVSGMEPVLIRASGPALSLSPFNLPGTLPDPELQLFNEAQAVIGSDTGWGANPQVISAAAAVGAFSWGNLPTKDSALLASLPPGPFTAQVSGASGDTGLSIAEIYDATPSGTYTRSMPRLVALSARADVGTGPNILFGGFAIGGSTARTVLIRASGPALIPLGVTGTLPDPQVVLFNSAGAVMASNIGWGANSQIMSAAAAVGAFPWGSLPTNDSALLITLPAGGYTAQVSGVSGDTGQSIVEVYEVP